MTENLLFSLRPAESKDDASRPAFTRGNLSISEVNHRISNNLALLASTVSMRATKFDRREEPVEAREVAAVLREIVARITAVGHLHRLLSTRPDSAKVEFSGHLRELCQQFVSALAPPGQVRLVESGSIDCTVSAEHLLPLSLIVTEVVTNSLKYAHPAGAPGKLMIGCRREADGFVVIEIADDGVGLPEGFDFESSAGIGSRTIRVLAKQIGAEIAFDSGPFGLSFTLRLPPADDSVRRGR